MVLLYVDMKGQVQVAGSSWLKKPVMSELFIPFRRMLNEETIRETAVEEEDERFLCQIPSADVLDPAVEAELDVWGWKELRQAVNVAVLPKDGKGKVINVKNFWTKAEKPSFWPDSVPFVSPAHRENNRCTLQKEDLRSIIRAFIKSTREPSRASQQQDSQDDDDAPQHDDDAAPQHDDDDAPQHDDDAAPQHDDDDAPQHDDDAAPQHDDDAAPQHDDDHAQHQKELEQLYYLYKRGEFTDLLLALTGEDMLSDADLFVLAEQVLEVKRPHVPPQARTTCHKSKYLPRDYMSSELSSLLGSLSEEPERLAVEAFFYWKIHEHHIRKDMERRGIKDGGFPDLSRKHVAPTMSLLTVLAGTLGQSIAVWQPASQMFSTHLMCVCEPAVVIGEIEITEMNSLFVRIQASGRPRTRNKQDKDQASYSRCPAASTNLIAERQGIQVFKKDLETLGPKAWLSDAVVDFMLSCPNIPDTVVLTSFVSQKLLVRPPLSDRPLNMTGCNVDGALKMLPKKISTTTLVLPVCNMIHWWLVKISKGRVEILCSLGHKYPQIEETLQRFGEAVFNTNKWSIFYPKVELQKNGHDCGLHVINNARLADAKPLTRKDIMGIILQHGS